MTADLLREAVRKALRETIPENDNGQAAAQQVEHSGTITVRIEVNATAARPSGANTRPAGNARITRLLSELESYRPIGRTWERPLKRIVRLAAP